MFSVSGIGSVTLNLDEIFVPVATIFGSALFCGDRSNCFLRDLTNEKPL